MRKVKIKCIIERYRHMNTFKSIKARKNAQLCFHNFKNKKVNKKNLERIRQVKKTEKHKINT